VAAPTVAELQAHLHERLAAPKRIEHLVVLGALVKGPTGKLKRVGLAEQLGIGDGGEGIGDGGDGGEGGEGGDDGDGERRRRGAVEGGERRGEGAGDGGGGETARGGAASANAGDADGEK
jgi:hypothetical protein